MRWCREWIAIFRHWFVVCWVQSHDLGYCWYIVKLTSVKSALEHKKKYKCTWSMFKCRPFCVKAKPKMHKCHLYISFVDYRQWSPKWPPLIQMIHNKTKWCQYGINDCSGVLGYAMTSCYGNAFRITCPLLGKPMDFLHKGWMMRSFDVFFVVSWTNGRVTGDLRRRDSQVM